MPSETANQTRKANPKPAAPFVGKRFSEIDREIALLIEAQFPILSVATHEEWRFLEQLEKIADDRRERHCADLDPKEKARKYQVVRWSVTDGLRHWSHYDDNRRRRPRRLRTDWMERDREAAPDARNPVDVLVNLRFPPETPVGHVSQSRDGQEASVDLRTALFVFCDLHHWLDREDRASRFNHVLVRALRDAAYFFKGEDESSVIIFLSPRSVVPLELEKEIQVIDYPLPTADELSVWFAQLEPALRLRYGDNSIDLSAEDRQRLIHALSGLTFDEARNVIQKSFANNGKLQANDIEEALREKQQIIKKDGTLEYFESDKSMADVGGLERLREWLDRRGIAFRGQTIDYEGKVIVLPVPKGLLMIGVPGGGKSLVAKAVATTWGLPLLRLDIGRIFGGLVGQSEENMRRAIRIAKSVAPAVLWLDEVEKAFPSSTGSGDAGTSLRVLNTFLTWLQEKTEPVFVVATGNNLKQVPPELTRKGRFDEIFYLGLPSRETRIEILKIHCRDLPITDDDYELLAEASRYFTGAEIEQSVKDSYYLLPGFLGPNPPTRAKGEPQAPAARGIFEVMQNVVPLARRELGGTLVLAETLKEAKSLAVPASDAFEELPTGGGAAPERAGWSGRGWDQ